MGAACGICPCEPMRASKAAEDMHPCSSEQCIYSYAFVEHFDRRHIIFSLRLANVSRHSSWPCPADSIVTRQLPRCDTRHEGADVRDAM